MCGVLRTFSVSQGITFMKINDQDQICFIRDAPEHPVKQLVQTSMLAR